jgi:BNR repeat-like domain/RTX calcium-binding nonapeptide repeat (4 copies)
MRRLAPFVLALVCVSTAAAAAPRGTSKSDTIVGTTASDTIKAGGGNDFVQVAFGGKDRVDCGPGKDVVSADLSDVVAANCEVVSRRLSIDPYSNADSQHETAVEPDSASFGNTIVAVYQLGRREGGAAANIGTAVSRNAGRTWTRSALPGTTVNATPPGPEVGASDPVVAYDAAHNVWLAGTLTIEKSFSHIEVARSADGEHWSALVQAAGGPILDKEWLACDNGASSPFRGRCYLEYSDDQANTTVSQYSTDGGATWSTPVRAGSILVGTQPVIQPNGTLVVVAGDYRDEQALSGTMAALRSTDGGATFTRFTVADLQAGDNTPMRAVSLPSVAADSTGTLYAVWSDCRFRTACAANDLVLSTSTDGMTWTAPTRITSANSAFIPGLAADPQRPGALAIVYAHYYGSCGSQGPCTLGISFAQSRNGGKTWTPPQRLDAQPFSTTWLPRAEGGRMVGDYFSTSYAGSRVVPVFALATNPLNSHFREAIFAASLGAIG